MSSVVQQPAAFPFEFKEFGFGPSPAKTPLRADSPAADHLSRQLTRWLNGEVDGRSCLIAGPRGSGKTTLIDTARRSCLESVKGMRPIVVRLHGPSLVRLPPELWKTNGEPGAETPPPAFNSTRYNDLVNEHVIRSLVKNLYQTAAEEFASEYHHLATERNPALLERSAQLRLTLDGAPGPAVLRDFWQSAGVLESGLLFHRQSGDNARSDQGMLEIVALATAAEAYRSCTGDFKKTESIEDKLTAERERKTEVSAKGKDFSQALVSLLAGVAVGAGTFAGTSSPLTAAIGGALTSLLGMLSFSFSSSLKRQSDSRRQITFLQDMSVTGLIHRFPLLLRRLEQAGIRPIFVVDELDKLPEAAKRLEGLVTNLKFLCADKAFFCFLTDRNYLNQLTRGNRASLNSILGTVYTDLLFVLYDPRSFSKYLDEVIAPAPPDLSPYDPREPLKLALMHSSLMLMFNLRAEIDTLCREGKLQVDPEDLLKVPRHQMAALMQIAIQTVLSDEIVKGRIEQDKDFGQIIYDALYYPTRRWHQNIEDLDCGRDELIEGMTSLNGDPGSADVRGYADALSEDDNKDFLYGQVRKLLRLIGNRDELQRLAKERNVASYAVLEPICRNTPAFLVPVAAEADKYRWLYNRFGAPFRPAALEDISQGALAAGSMLDQFGLFLVGTPLSLSVPEVHSRAAPFELMLMNFEDALTRSQMSHMLV